MRRKLLIAVLAGAGGAAAGVLFSVVSLRVIGSLAEQGAWLLGLSAGLGAFAGASIGWICTATQARTGGRPAKTLAVVAVAFLVGIVVARRLFGHAPGGMQLLLAMAGAVAASLALRLKARLTTPASAEPRQPRSWRFQFTLATLLTMLTLVSIGLALYVRGPIRRHQVAKEIVRTGGRVRYGSQAPYWVVDLLGDVSRGFVSTVTEVYAKVQDDSDLARLAVFPQIHSLHLEGNGISDDGLKYVGNLYSLEELDLGGLSVGDAGIEYLLNLNQLRFVNLPSGISGNGLARLASLPNLESLWINQGRIADDDLRCLASLTHLRQLWFWQTAITDDQLRSVGKLKSLECLLLDNAPISDVGLAKLRGLTRLKKLHLAGTNITDAGLKHLHAMAQLESLDLSRTQVTGNGFAQLDSLGQLRGLRLGACPVTDKGLGFVGRFSTLQDLDLERTHITDDGLIGLQPLRKLYRLVVSSNSAISDAGLVHLEPLEDMVYFESANTLVTSAALARLERVWEQRRRKNEGMLSKASP